MQVKGIAAGIYVVVGLKKNVELVSTAHLGAAPRRQSDTRVCGDRRF